MEEEQFKYREDFEVLLKDGLNKTNTLEFLNRHMVGNSKKEEWLKEALLRIEQDPKEEALCVAEALAILDGEDVLLYIGSIMVAAYPYKRAQIWGTVKEE